MFIRVSSPGRDLSEAEIDKIQQDVEKIDRRLKHIDEVYLEIRLGGDSGAPTRDATMELEYGRNRLIARSDAPDVHQAIRMAREDILRQINDRERGRSHSDYRRH